MSKHLSRPIDGIKWDDEPSPPWETAGLAYVGAAGREGWFGELKDALKNTNTINFIIDGMDVLNPMDVITVNRHPPASHAFVEMDYIIAQNYLDKLHLWRNNQEITGQERSDWIDAWKNTRNLP